MHLCLLVGLCVTTRWFPRRTESPSHKSLIINFDIWGDSSSFFLCHFLFYFPRFLPLYQHIHITFISKAYVNLRENKQSLKTAQGAASDTPKELAGSLAASVDGLFLNSVYLMLKLLYSLSVLCCCFRCYNNLLHRGPCESFQEGEFIFVSLLSF